MVYKLRKVSKADLDSVLALNESVVPHVNSIPMNEMAWFMENAACFLVATAGDGEEESVAGFLIGLREGLDYKSANYRWFSNKYAQFAYIDRVAISANARRAGIAQRFYRKFAEAVPKSVQILCCEVNVRPPNEISMKFHHDQGFEQIGSLASDNGSKEVALLAKPLL